MIVRESEEAEKCVSEATVIKYEEADASWSPGPKRQALLKLRSLGAPGPLGRLDLGVPRGAGTMDKDASEPFSVAFGGGGVRSGAFCCGVLWALAETNRLAHVTHLSSVSGGKLDRGLLTETMRLCGSLGLRILPGGLQGCELSGGLVCICYLASTACPGGCRGLHREESAQCGLPGVFRERVQRQKLSFKWLFNIPCYYLEGT